MVMQIQNVFPTPIGISFNNNIPHDEHEILLNAEYHKHEVYDMIVSKEKYILNSGITKIKSFIQQELNEYSKKTLGTDQKLKFTQSWCTKHEGVPQYTFPHTHQNSIVSGVYYILANDSEGLTFYKNDDFMEKYITWETDSKLVQQNEWCWQWQTFPVHTGMLLLFPSRIKHSVEGKNVLPGVRCSLAFNTWFDGDIGIINSFSRLG
jgi:hypothetical protein